jgi:hypothetical protein
MAPSTRSRRAAADVAVTQTLVLLSESRLRYDWLLSPAKKHLKYTVYCGKRGERLASYTETK